MKRTVTVDVPDGLKCWSMEKETIKLKRCRFYDDENDSCLLYDKSIDLDCNKCEECKQAESYEKCCKNCKHVGIKDFVFGYCKNQKSDRYSVNANDSCEYFKQA